MTRKLAVLDAPCHFGVRPEEPDAVPGSQAYAVRQRDLVARLGARDVGQIEPPEPDPANPCPVGCQGIPRFIQALAARTREIVSAREFPVVLGGECSILVGSMLGLRSLGRFGLVFVGGRDDFADPDELGPHNSLLTAAGLDLAVATGNGPAALADLQGLRPYVDEGHVVLFALASGDDQVDAALPADAPFRIERVKNGSARAAAERALRYLEELPIDGFWIHVDADVLDPGSCCECGDDEVSYERLTEALRVFLASDRAVGLELTIFDPELDPDGACGDRLVDSVVRAFQPDSDAASGNRVV